MLRTQVAPLPTIAGAGQAGYGGFPGHIEQLTRHR